MTIKYSSDSQSINIGDGWTTLFKNDDVDECPFTQCTLKTSNCKDQYSGSTFSITESTPWLISANRQILDGYEESVCVDCMV